MKKSNNSKIFQSLITKELNKDSHVWFAKKVIEALASEKDPLPAIKGHLNNLNEDLQMSLELEQTEEKK